MQAAAPEVVDFAGETAETLALYGIDEKETDEFGTRCLLARRMIERGVRFVQLYSATATAGTRTDVAKNHGHLCRRPTARSPACSAICKRAVCSTTRW